MHEPMNCVGPSLNFFFFFLGGGGGGGHGPQPPLFLRLWYSLTSGDRGRAERQKRVLPSPAGSQLSELQNGEHTKIITSVMIYHRGASLSKQHTDLLCTKQDLSHTSRYVDESSSEIISQVSHTYANSYSQCDYICIN